MMILGLFVVSVAGFRFGEFYLYQPCGFQVIEIASVDGFVLRFNTWDSDAEVGRVLRKHDGMGRNLLEAASIMDAPAIRVIGPEGLAYYFDPKTTADLIRGSLANYYSSSTMDAMLAGEYANEPSVRLRLLARGTDPELVDAVLNLDIRYVGRSAFADAMRTYEVDRLAKLQQQKSAPPVREIAIVDRIKIARTKAFEGSSNICYALRWLGLSGRTLGI
jgi:hypothetical protein